MEIGKRMNTLPVNGFNLAYTRRGKGNPLMLVHGYPLDSSIWNDLTPLLEKDFDLISPDLRGFGQSTTTPSGYTISDMADDLVGLLDHLGIEKTILAGHSMGGYISLAFARKYPRRVSGLALIASQAGADTPEGKERRYKTAAEVDEKGVGSVADSMTPKLSNETGVRAFVRELIGRQSRQAVTGALKAMAERADSMSMLATLEFPLVLIHGDSDQLIPIERAIDIVSVKPSAKLFELKGAGHMPMMEFPRQVADGLMHFIR